jgi:hypothetical protein
MLFQNAQTYSNKKKKEYGTECDELVSFYRMIETTEITSEKMYG